MDYIGEFLIACAQAKINRQIWHNPHRFRNYLLKRVPDASDLRPLIDTSSPRLTNDNALLEWAREIEAEGNDLIETGRARDLQKDIKVLYSCMEELEEIVTAKDGVSEDVHETALQLLHTVYLKISHIQCNTGKYDHGEALADLAIQMEELGCEQGARARALYQRGLARVNAEDPDTRKLGQSDLEDAYYLAPGNEDIEEALRDEAAANAKYLIPAALVCKSSFSGLCIT